MGGTWLYQAIPETDGGYSLVGASGGQAPFGDAVNYGPGGSHPVSSPVVGVASTPSRMGYWYAESNGGVLAFGEANFYGSMGGGSLNEPIVGMAATPDGNGYWLVAADGGIFTFGDAAFHGSGTSSSGRPFVELTATT